MIFAINGTDISNDILTGTYQINDVDAFEEWKDGWGVVHHDIYGHKCKGSFELLFKTAADYRDFVQLVKSSKTSSGWHVCEVSINNTFVTERRNCFLTFEPKRDRDGVNRDYFGKFSVVVEEA